jgi:uncharacterized damage-inducible protein DinB
VSFSKAIAGEFEHEMANTRRVLEGIPDDKLDWRAHPKLNTIGWNANHIAEIPGWLSGVLAHVSFDIAPVGGPRYESPRLSSREAILGLFDQNLANARSALSTLKDEDLGVVWSLLEGGKTIVAMPRAAVIRGFIFSHLIHHRAHLCAYLRMNDIQVPSMYGPVSD